MNRSIWLVVVFLASVFLGGCPDSSTGGGIPFAAGFTTSLIDPSCQTQCPRDKVFPGTLFFSIEGRFENFTQELTATGDVTVAATNAGPFGAQASVPVVRNIGDIKRGLGDFSWKCTGPKGTIELKNAKYKDASVLIDCSAAPEIAVAKGAPFEGEIGHRGTHGVGSKPVGIPFELSYVVSNSGRDPLTIGATTFSRQTNCTGVVSTPPVGPVAVGATTPMTVSVTPLGAGDFFCAFSIINDDLDENPYQITIAGNVDASDAPEISVVRDGEVPVADGSTEQVGEKTANVAFTRSYKIQNTGLSPLTVGAVSFPSPTNCTAVVSQVPDATVAATTGSTTLGLTVTPTAAGPFSCPVSFVNNDLDENPFDFTIAGTAIALPDITVTRQAALTNGGTDALGNRGLAPFTISYTIKNDGLVDLTTVGAIIPVLSPTNCAASITGTAPSATVTPANTTTLTITVSPTSAGAFSFGVNIASNDPDENPFAFTASGTAVTAPEITVAGFANNGIDEVGTRQIGAPFSRSYTVVNDGSATLNVSGITISTQTNCTAVVNTAPTNFAVAPLGNAPVQISVTPTAIGTFSCVFLIASDDSDENPHSIAINGSGISAAPEINIPTVADGGNDNVGNQFYFSAFTRTYSIQNTGTALLTVGAVTFNSQVNCNISVSTPPGASVTPGNATPLVLSITPTIQHGAFSCGVSVVNNDGDENPYNWTISGQVP